MNLRDTILAIKPRVEIVNVWGLDLKIRSWSAKERIVFSQWAEANKADTLLMFANLIVKSVIDDDDNLVFTDDDIEALQGKDFDSVFKLAQAIMVLNGMEAKEENPLSHQAS